MIKLYFHKIPKQYNFGYSVKDSYSGDTYSHHEQKIGESTKGEYKVLLPDGLVQVLTLELLQILKKIKNCFRLLPTQQIRMATMLK